MTQPRVVVVGLGPAGPELVTQQALAEIARVGTAFVRTTRHPSAAVVPSASSFDHVYDEEPTLDEVYERIVDELVEAAARARRGALRGARSPLVAERTVELLACATSRVEVDDRACAVVPRPRLGAARRRSARRRRARSSTATGSPSTPPASGGRCSSPSATRRAVLSDIKLAVDDEPSDRVVVLQRLGLPDEQVFEVDVGRPRPRRSSPTTSPRSGSRRCAAPVASEVVRFVELVRTAARASARGIGSRPTLAHPPPARGDLRGARGDRRPRPGSAETVDHLEEELGDLLFQVFFHATLAAEEGAFTLADVARVIHDKLVHRHPHVFGDVEVDTRRAGGRATGSRSRRPRRAASSVFDGIPGDLPSLLYAHKVQRKAASVGFDWDDVDGALPKVDEELDELREAIATAVEGDIEAELGDLLFAVVDVARHLDVDPEAALRGASAKFRLGSRPSKSSRGSGVTSRP